MVQSTVLTRTGCGEMTLRGRLAYKPGDHVSAGAQDRADNAVEF
jgi:hypothetical protein